MKKFILSIVAFTSIMMLSCNKEETNKIQSEDQIEALSLVGPSVRVGIRLYRPKYDCLEKLSLCIGKKKPKKSTDDLEYRELYYPGEIPYDPNIRVAEADIFYLSSSNSIKIKFLSDFDKSDGTIIVIDQGFNNFELDSETLSILGLNQVNLETGSYQIEDIDITSDKFGEVTIPLM